MKLREIMTTNIATTAPESTVSDAARVMQAHNVGAIPVCGPNSKILGIITDRDIVVRCIANNGNPSVMAIKDIMTKDLILGNPSMDTDQATRLMAQHKIRRLPVVQNDTLVGIVTLGDLAARHMLQDEAGAALSYISTPARPENMLQ